MRAFYTYTQGLAQSLLYFCTPLLDSLSIFMPGKGHSIYFMPPLYSKQKHMLQILIFSIFAFIILLLLCR